MVVFLDLGGEDDDAHAHAHAHDSAIIAGPAGLGAGAGAGAGAAAAQKRLHLRQLALRDRNHRGLKTARDDDGDGESGHGLGRREPGWGELRVQDRNAEVFAKALGCYPYVGVFFFLSHSSLRAYGIESPSYLPTRLHTWDANANGLMLLQGGVRNNKSPRSQQPARPLPDLLSLPPHPPPFPRTARHANPPLLQ